MTASLKKLTSASSFVRCSAFTGAHRHKRQGDWFLFKVCATLPLYGGHRLHVCAVGVADVREVSFRVLMTHSTTCGLDSVWRRKSEVRRSSQLSSVLLR